jgi:hypothetical protein
LADAQKQLITASQNGSYLQIPSLQKQYGAIAAGAYKEIEGSGRQAQIDHLIQTTMPSWQEKASGDYSKVQNGLSAFMQGGQAAPVAQKYLGGLDKYASTNLDKGIATSSNAAPINQAGGKTQAAPAQKFDQDVLAYASKHGISPDQAKSIKTQRMMGNK